MCVWMEGLLWLLGLLTPGHRLLLAPRQVTAQANKGASKAKKGKKAAATAAEGGAGEEGEEVRVAVWMRW